MERKKIHLEYLLNATSKSIFFLSISDSTITCLDYCQAKKTLERKNAHME